MSLLLFVFIVLSVLSIAGALGVVFSRNVVYSAMSLLLALLMAAGFFVILLAPFLALVQVLIYAGAVTILILFALMLTRAGETLIKLDNAQKPLALVAAGGVMAALVATVVVTTWPSTTEQTQTTALETLGRALFNQWAAPFEIASLVLLVALIGAIVISRAGEQE